MLDQFRCRAGRQLIHVVDCRRCLAHLNRVEGLVQEGTDRLQGRNLGICPFASLPRKHAAHQLMIVVGEAGRHGRDAGKLRSIEECLFVLGEVFVGNDCRAVRSETLFDLGTNKPLTGLVEQHLVAFVSHGCAVVQPGLLFTVHHERAHVGTEGLAKSGQRQFDDFLRRSRVVRCFEEFVRRLDREFVVGVPFVERTLSRHSHFVLCKKARDVAETAGLHCRRRGPVGIEEQSETADYLLAHEEGCDPHH